jgi:lipoprotein-releasing system ATP-binding protein
MSRKLIYDPTEDLPEDLLVAMFNVYKIFRTEKIEHVALRGISLAIHKSELVGCIGPSGSGKTTLLTILGGLMLPTAGTVYWEPLKSDLSRFSQSQLAAVRNEFLGYLSQMPYLLPQISVLKNIMYAGMIHNRKKNTRELKGYALELLERVGMKTSEVHRSPSTFSGGEIQRIALASALINKPHIVLADEPTGNLDYDTSERFLDLLEEINETLGTAFFVVTHSSQVARRTERIFELSDGMLIGHHTVANLSNLDHTRTLVADAQNRIFLSDELMDRLGSPWGFSVEFDKKNLVLTPVASAEDLGKGELSEKAVTCQLCGFSNSSTNKFCDQCGSFLSRFKLFAEE